METKIIKDALLKAVQTECAKKRVSVEHYCFSKPFFENIEKERNYYCNKMLKEERQRFIKDPVDWEL